MKKIKLSPGGILACLLEIVVGILLLINPLSFTAGIILAAGIVMLISGVISIVQYFRADAEEAAAGQCMVKGLAALLAGGFCALRADMLTLSTAWLAVIYGLVVLLAGLSQGPGHL